MKAVARTDASFPYREFATMTAHLLDYYQAIEKTSQAMLDAALLSDWDEVVRLEGACALLIEQLRERSASQTLSAEERARKHRIMLTLLRHDAQIRELVEPWVDDLGLSLAPTHSTLLH